MRGNVTCWFLSTATLLAGAAAAAGHCPPTLRVAASSNRDAGLQIGAHFAPMIRDRFQRSSQLTALRAFVATAPGKTALDVLLRSARVAYGSYVEEMEAIADGAGVSRTDAALMNFRHELGALAPGGAAPSAAAAYSECSDVSAAGFIAHNEDGFDPSNNHTYILNVSIAGETTQWWLAYCYAGELASPAFGFNGNGVGYTLNAMHCATHLHGGALGRNLISRALLVERTLESARALIQGSVSATGHNYQVFGRAGTKVGPTVLSIETLPPNRSHVVAFGPLSSMSSHEAGSGGPLQALFHSNCYLFIDPAGSGGSGGGGGGVVSASPWQHLRCLDNNVDSAARLARAQALPPPLSLEAALHTLGDIAGQSGGYPIFADPTAPPNADGRTTLNTVHFDIERRVAALLGGNPGVRSPLICENWAI